MTLTISKALSDHLTTRTTHRHATCWRIERTDGQILRFTDCCHALTLEDGFTYSPLGGGQSSARSREGGLVDTNAEFHGVLTSDKIKHDDLRAGRYDDAKVNEYVVDWSVPWAGSFRSQRYWIQNLSFTGEEWKAQIGGIPSRLVTPVGIIITRSCRTHLGSKKCGIDLALPPANTVENSVTATSIDTQRQVFRASGLSSVYNDDDFAGGFLRFLNGANIGLQFDIKSYVKSTRQITLFMSTPFDIVASGGSPDRFLLVCGCNGAFSTCRDVYANVVNFRGYPDAPGTDAVIQVAGT